MKQLTLKERNYIEFALTLDTPISKIALHLGRDRSTIYREIKRNSMPKGKKSTLAQYPYQATSANNCAKLRKRKVVTKTKATKGLIKRILHYLNLKFSPEQIVHGAPNINVSVGTIYNWIDKQIIPFDKKKLRLKGKRVRKRKEAGRLLSRPDSSWFIQHSIDNRPIECKHRIEFGHWEADSVLSRRGSNAAIATFIERKTRQYLAFKMPDKTSHSMYQAIKRLIKLYPSAIKSITCDRGTEFINQTYVAKLEKKGIKIYIAHAYSPQERGSNENHNGLLREYFPKGVDFQNVSQKE